MMGSVSELEPRVLVVEDDHGLRDVLARGLREHDVVVVTARDGAGALGAVRGAGPDAFDAVVLDIGLPDSDGRDVCQALRAAGLTAPVLFLTARDQLHDVLSGFAAGGDDYLAKPFHLSELVARLRVALRRSAAARPAPSGLALDPTTHALVGPSGTQRLTPTEFRVLAALMARSGEVVRRRDLLAAGWPDGARVADNTLDQYVARLRRKVDAAGDAGRSIGTAHGVGYTFT
ncbi:two-component system, OmpR family, response regulator MprA [Klenkia brasiliensis]|uniref:Two-component system, OmpR family, response regulator MprA n=1 Tax=Klenkia brasiliensis TaxID=333142 RepID=A0A1G7US82_9ACTN|nr:two-component system, OmpR family, response regulator MprA [Klenkia brasiliensis]